MSIRSFLIVGAIILGLSMLSYINMKLRDSYTSLDEMCDDMQLDRDELISRMAEAGFEYSATHNRFC